MTLMVNKRLVLKSLGSLAAASALAPSSWACSRVMERDSLRTRR